MRKKVTLALQGGGAHGAFTWGVLDAFLADGRLDVTGISGTSAGAMNAAVYADGLREGGPDRARKQLAEFWRAVSLDGGMSDQQRQLFDAFLGVWDPLRLRNAVTQNAGAYLSPYDFNPLDINPLRDVICRLIDFEALRATDDLKLFIAATNVRTGKARIFRRPELTIDMLMASACLPTIFKAVEVGGEAYWDGGYMGNPALYPLYTETECCDVILVQINPIRRDDVPRTSSAIMARLNEITFNAPLLQEFRAIDFVARLVDSGRLRGTHYKKVLLHLVEGGPALDRYGPDTKMEADFDFFLELFDIGYKVGRKFLEENFESIGVRGTLELKEQLV
ncbi:MAG: patatin-like phospholipase family protein [Methylocystis sp.]|uniref:patatin-like phospholipase family protein n=1 Tax=Methylocystis sp. TaxID=1911079 RepID=UPI003DA56F51